jgi:transcriptional regulator with XRE-family HTH domain
MEARDLVRALVKSGLTQAAIAERTGIPQPTISKVSRGDVADVLSRNYRKLLALHDERLGVSVGADLAQGVDHAA